VSLINIHLRRALVSVHHARERIADLIVSWSHYDTNGRRAKGRVSPITKIFEVRRSLACRRFDCQLGPI
jgi:hypothetical protein